jgi:hypothetical protein
MTKEFAPYDRALKLKQLGFDELCISYYTVYGKFSNDYSAPRKYNSEFELGSYISAPTFSQAFRWFREEYNQHSFIELVFEDEIRFDYVLYVNEDEDDCIDYGDGPFETYEDAELALLDKLIEIAEGIKSKK